MVGYLLCCRPGPVAKEGHRTFVWDGVPWAMGLSIFCFVQCRTVHDDRHFAHRARGCAVALFLFRCIWHQFLSAFICRGS